MALDAGQVNIQAKIKIRVNTFNGEGEIVEIVESTPVEQSYQHIA